MQFAYNEVSFMLVRLLQHFSAIEFVPEVAPQSIPPPGYTDSPGSDGTDRVWMTSHLTAFAKVRIFLRRYYVADESDAFCHQGGLWVKMTEAKD